MIVVTKVDSMRGKRVRIVDVDGYVFVGKAFQHGVVYNDENDEEVDAICIATETNVNTVFSEDDIVDYEILD